MNGAKAGVRLRPYGRAQPERVVARRSDTLGSSSPLRNYVGVDIRNARDWRARDSASPMTQNLSAIYCCMYRKNRPYDMHTIPESVLPQPRPTIDHCFTQDLVGVPGREHQTATLSRKLAGYDAPFIDPNAKTSRPCID